MPVDLSYIIKRNNSSLKKFILKNRLTSYALLLEYCQDRNFNPCSEEEYNNVNALLEANNLKSEIKNDTKKVTNKNAVDRAASETQKPRKRRYRRKKQQSSSKLSNSADRG